MKKEEIFKIINELKTKISKDNLNRYLKNHYPDIYNEIQKQTEFLNKFIIKGNKNKQISLYERLYCIEHNLTDRPLCKHCGSNYVCNFNRKTNDYGNWCSPKCQASDKTCIEKSKKTKLNKYGNENYTNTEKSKITRNDKYGSYSPNDFSDKIKQTKIKKYGDKNYVNVEKSKKTKLKKYGDENYNNIEKCKKTKFERYNCEYYNNREKFLTTINNFSEDKINQIKEKRTKTNIEKYGVETPSKNPNIRNKIEQTFKTKYGVSCGFETYTARKNCKIKLRDKAWNRIITDKSYTPLFTHKFFINNYSKNLNLNWKCNKCETEFISRYDNGFHLPCPNCFPRKTNGFSQMEHDIYDFIFAFYNDIIYWRCDKNKKFLYNKEIDILIPNGKLAIEFDGIYWHSDIGGKDKNYHLNKTNLCEEKGYQLIHIFENEWVYKQDIVKSRLKNLLGIHDKVIYGRKCEVKEVDKSISFDFQNDNHIQGGVYSPLNIGLFYHDELVSLMTFSKCRFNKTYEWELVRFCNKLNYHVIGGAGKLLKYFEINYKPKSLISYADRRWSKGDLYHKLGFNFLHNSSPNYWYFKNNSLLLQSRVKFQKHKLKNILENFDENLSETENMKNNGYGKIYDCGNMVFEKIY
jgi:hypothetical protein